MGANNHPTTVPENFEEQTDEDDTDAGGSAVHGWIELVDEGEYVRIDTPEATYHIQRFGASDWQIDYESDTGAGQPGTVDTKQKAINYVLADAGIIENPDPEVHPRKVVIT